MSLKRRAGSSPALGTKNEGLHPHFFVPSGTFCLIGESVPQPLSVASLHGRHSFTLIFFVPGGSSPKVVIRTGLTQLLLGISPFIRRQSAEENPPE